MSTQVQYTTVNSNTDFTLHFVFVDVGEVVVRKFEGDGEKDMKRVEDFGVETLYIGTRQVAAQRASRSERLTLANSSISGR